MTTFVYVAAQDDDKVSIFTMDEGSGGLSLQSEVALAGGPSLLAISADKQTMYVGHRSACRVTSHRIDQATGGLTETGAVDTQDSPTYLVQDRTGRHLLVLLLPGRTGGGISPGAMTAVSGVGQPHR